MQTNPMETINFPTELCVKPQVLIGVSGLDTRNNAVHKAIWETFSSNKRPDGLPIIYKLIDNAYEFPVVKPKRNSYEWYIPKGILKKNWMDKHLNKIPATIVIFYDLDWNEPQWSERMIECASRVQSMRVALEGRNTKLCVVLIQTKPPLPTGDDPLAAERAVALCSSCELNAKSLFILPHGDHLQGYTVRLENAFYELAQNYYHGEVRNIKSHREHLNKSTHQYLFVRHQFKMGFLNELKQDAHTAHKHYTHSYNNLLEIRIVDTNAMEIRTVAGFINYKLCRLMFALNLPRDAISQFKAHTERFKSRIGFQELAFEHHAWISTQFSIFGDIFDEAVKLGLPAVQTQHPGLYYQQAVNHAMLRKKTCEELCKNVIAYPAPDPLEGMSSLEFYGQRPWRPGKMTAEPPDPQIEWNGIKALQYLEKQVNHSAIIIGLYGLAVAQFKTYRCPRTRRHLIVQMADEYYNSGDYGKALTLLTHMLWDYRTECWWDLLSHILEKALTCAYLTTRIDDYILLSLELLGPQITVGEAKQQVVYENFNRLLKKHSPQSEPHYPVNMQRQWGDVLKQAMLNLTLDMSNVVSCIDCKARFLQNKYQADEIVQIEVYIRNSCKFPLSFMKVTACINSPMKSFGYSVDDRNNNPNLQFGPMEIKKFLIEFSPDPADINKELQISSINIFLGSSLSALVDLKFSGLGNDKNTIPLELIHFRQSRKGVLDFDNIRPSLNAMIVPRNLKLSLTFEHAKPALLGEWYKIDIHLYNEKEYEIANLEFEISLVDDDGVDTTEFAMKPGDIEKLPIKFRTSNLSNNKIASHLFMRAHKVGERNISVRVTFNLLSNEKIPSLTEEVVHVSVVKPFEITTRCLSKLFEDVNKFYVGEEFVIMPVINCLSPWPITIEDTNLEYSSTVYNVDSTINSQVTGVELKSGETGAEIYMGNTRKRSDIPITIGNYTVKWKRLNGETTMTKTIINGPSVDWIPLDLKMIVPAHGLVRTPMLIEYHLMNKSSHLIHLDVSIEGSEAFMFAGYKQFQTTILPESTRTLKYNLYPLIAGSVSLPKLVLTIPDGTEGPALRQDQMNGLLQRSLPTHIFVMPQIKGEPDVPNIVKAANLLST